MCAQPRMCIAADIMQELSDANALVDAQVAACMVNDVVVNQLFLDLQQRISTMTCTTHDKAMLTRALNDGPWTDTQRQQLATNVLQGVCGKASPAGA